ncbi:MAG: hypothetical protein ACR2LN_04765 [Candidatus Levyibacteriota bacterium]
MNKLILFIATIVSLTSLYFSFNLHYILTYNDAASHLNIARRMVDSLTPGVAQIGTVWLPLPHLLMLPFAMNDFLWHTGLAGSIVSIIAFIAGVSFLYKLLYILTENIWGSVIGTLIFALNPNLLYMQTTPMTETLLITAIVISIYYLAKFSKTYDINDLILCSAFVSAATLIRYDGWFLFACLSILLPIWLSVVRGRRRAESSFILFVASGGFGIYLWFLWNYFIFGDALYFITGPYSAAAQQKVLQQVGQLPTQHNIYLAGLYYIWAVINNNGMLLTIAGFIGICIVPFILRKKSQLLVLFAIISPIIFNIIALFLGQSAMNVPQAPTNPGMFNIRYGMMALPAIAVVLGIVASNKYARIIVLFLLIAQSYLFVIQGVPVTLADGLHGLQETYYTIEASKWLAEHYKGGLILTSLASHDAFVARAGIPMKNYIHEGTRNHWTDALREPSKSVQYIAVLSYPPDSVYRILYNNPDFLENYEIIHTYKKFDIYEKK